MPGPDTIDQASLDRFVDSLLVAGFEPTGDMRSWVGPLHPALRGLTAATTMKVVVRDGWPFLHPKVLVEGLRPGLHRRLDDGDVCLWEDGDPSLGWMTWEDVSARIEAWTHGDADALTATDPALDSHLYFRSAAGGIKGLATINLADRPIRDWETQPLRAKAKDGLLEIGEGDLRGRWYTRDTPRAPAQSLRQLRSQLRRRQQSDLDDALKSVGTPGGISFLVFAWNTPVGPNLLALGLERDAAGLVVARAYEAARTDPDILRLRAGPDAGLLASKSVAVLGVGAIGSHVADLLARSGVGQITVCDGQRLRPGDIVRHRASRLLVGDDKPKAISLSIRIDAPWTKVETREAIWRPRDLRALCQQADLVVDAVGLFGSTVQSSRVCADNQCPLVSVALYRHGAVGRVRLQPATTASPIAARSGDDRFPKIPPAPDELEAAWEAGCGTPIAQAPPASVVSIAAAAARIAIDALVGRVAGDLDQIEVYAEVPETVFETQGSFRFPAS